MSLDSDAMWHHSGRVKRGTVLVRDEVRRRCAADPELSQNQIARELGCDPGYFSRVVNGEREPNLPLAIRLREKLGTPLEAWVEEVPTEAA
jgi:plasmid maintenance system antidote protein VapI